MSFARSRLLALLAVLVTAGAWFVTVTTADSTPRWAPVSSASIRPGVQMYTAGAQCTANFVFYDAAGNVYVGYAAHCAGKGSSSDINGCKSPSNPVGTAVSFRKGGNLFTDGTEVGRGTLAYSSWLSMQRLHTSNANRCTYNDFALVRVRAADKGKVNPTVPVWGGPRTFGGTALTAGAKLYTVGNSSLRFGSGFGSGKTGSVIARIGGGLAYQIKTGSPGIPGDSGSGFLDASGRAMGVLSTIEIGLGLGITPVSNVMGDLYQEITWARTYSGIKGLRLAAGTQPFSTRGR
jgi:hypothetical protein